MIAILTRDADVARVRRALAERGLWVESVQHPASGGGVLLTTSGYSTAVPADEIAAIPGVEAVYQTKSPHPRVDAQPRPLRLGEIAVGPGERPILISGPCSVESPEQIREIARRLALHEVAYLRGGAYKPRTSPYSFQGHGDKALGWLREAADEFGMRVVTEALGEDQVAEVAEVADMIQIGSRNMQNFSLLKAVGRAEKPVLLKRAMSATVEEWLLAGEYLLSNGAAGVVFCERGIRGFDPSTRNLLDLGAVALLATVHGLPVIVDPSHATGRRELVVPLGRAAVAAGAAGLMIETHHEPGEALSDGAQAVPPEIVAELAAELRGGARR